MNGGSRYRENIVDGFVVVSVVVAAVAAFAAEMVDVAASVIVLKAKEKNIPPKTD